MGWHFRRTVKVAPGIRLNFGKRGTSVSIGPRGSKVTFGNNGTYVSGGIPGTGAYYRKKVSSSNKNSSSNFYSGFYATSRNGDNTVGAIILCILILIVCIVLFVWSFGWDWSLDGSVKYRKSISVDISWLKWLFYPIVIFGSLFAVFGIYAVMSTNNNKIRVNSISSGSEDNNNENASTSAEEECTPTYPKTSITESCVNKSSEEKNNAILMAEVRDLFRKMSPVGEIKDKLSVVSTSYERQRIAEQSLTQALNAFGSTPDIPLGIEQYIDNVINELSLRTTAIFDTYSYRNVLKSLTLNDLLHKKVSQRLSINSPVILMPDETPLWVFNNSVYYEASKDANGIKPANVRGTNLSNGIYFPQEMFEGATLSTDCLVKNMREQ